jgi:hypothetical protein
VFPQQPFLIPLAGMLQEERDLALPIQGPVRPMSEEFAAFTAPIESSQHSSVSSLPPHFCFRVLGCTQLSHSTRRGERESSVSARRLEQHRGKFSDRY